MNTANIINIIKKHKFYILAVAVIIVLALVLYLIFGGKTRLEQEFSLSIGRPAGIAGEDLHLTFQDVLQDSRCPTGAVCITEGAVVCLLEIKQGDAVYNIELAQPGLYYDYSQEIFGGYKYNFIVEPYPEVDKEIAEGDYRLLLILEKMPDDGADPTDYYSQP
ncbi:hypothetical protein ACFLYS_01915 [Chloroflexota bacterium]